MNINNLCYNAVVLKKITKTFKNYYLGNAGTSIGHVQDQMHYYSVKITKIGHMLSRTFISSK